MLENSLKYEFYSLLMMTKRGLKLFFKDKAGVFFSFLSPLIVLLLYVLFLGDVQISTIKAYYPVGVPFDEIAIKGFVDSWMISGVISIACITVSLCANMIMVQDKTRGIINDLLSSPLKRRVITFSYFFYNFIITVTLVLAVTFVCFIYLAARGSWYMSAADVFGVIGTVFYASLSSTLITVFIYSFIRSEAAMSAFTSIISAMIGFFIGVYMPLNVMPKFMQYISCIFPGTHASGLFRNFLMRGALDHLGTVLTPQATDSIAKSFSMDLNFFGKDIGTDIMAVYICVMILIFVILNLIMASLKNSIFLSVLSKNKKHKKTSKV